MTNVELRTAILTRLGSPVINIELATEQMDLYIQDTVDKFIEVHYDGLDEGVIFLNITAGTTEYDLPGNIHSVMEIMTPSSSSSISAGDPLLIQPFLVGNTYSMNTHFSYVDMEVWNQNYAMWRSYSSSGKQTMFQFNSTTGKLNLFVEPTEDKVIALKVHAAPSTFEDIYNNSWVQKYATALCQIAWAQNISKYEGATLPGGVSLNYNQILTEGKEAKELLETELYERYQEPIDFFFG